MEYEYFLLHANARKMQALIIVDLDPSCGKIYVVHKYIFHVLQLT